MKTTLFCFVLLALISACTPATALPTVAPSATIVPIPPTVTATTPPSATPVPPTSTPLPPTATALPLTATSAPEILASKPEDLIGIWKAKFNNEAILQYFNADGSFGIKWPDSKSWIASGKFRFEGTRLIFEEPLADSSCRTGTWQVYVTKQEGMSIRLRYEKVADVCEDRIKVNTETDHTRK